MIGQPILRIGEAELAAIARHARAAYPEECCGILLGTTDENDAAEVSAAAAVPNREADDRRRRYRIDPETICSVEEEAERAGHKIVGFYHSHADHPAAPSPTDRELAWPWYRYLIIPVSQGRPGEPRVWSLADDRATFVEGRLVAVALEHKPLRHAL
jgi:proteasome lid subunit RPN8/RPN11